MKRAFVSEHLPGVQVGKSYALKKVRMIFSRHTLILENGAFEHWCLLNSNSVLIVRTPFEDFYTFTAPFTVPLSALGIGGERVQPVARSAEAPQSPTEGNAQKQNIFDKFKRQ